MRTGSNGWTDLRPFTSPLAWGDKEAGNQRMEIHLSAELTHVVDKIREKHKWDFIECMSYRSWFIETAVRFFIHYLWEKGLIEKDYTNA